MTGGRPDRAGWHKVRVVAYAGSTGEEEPRRVAIDGAEHEVEEILDRWREPGGRFFRVRIAGGRRLLLCCREPDLGWWLVPDRGRRAER